MQAGIPGADRVYEDYFAVPFSGNVTGIDPLQYIAVTTGEALVSAIAQNFRFIKVTSHLILESKFFEFPPVPKDDPSGVRFNPSTPLSMRSIVIWVRPPALIVVRYKLYHTLYAQIHNLHLVPWPCSCQSRGTTSAVFAFDPSIPLGVRAIVIWVRPPAFVVVMYKVYLAWLCPQGAM